ncbi:ATP/GTP-binding protein [Capnocytophaga canis]|uniref:AAA family ATPase n=1 Tax=Capnocytophaga canis TaxID=1848903 RepID=UPI00370D7EE8
MLARFKVSNFKSFGKNFEIDFTKAKKYDFNKECINNELINNAIIYGKNGTGKSNLGFAIFDIVGHLTDKEKSEIDYKHYINANSDSSYVEFGYEFIFDSNIVTYEYKKSDYETIEYEKFSINEKVLALIDRTETREKTILAFKGTENLKTEITNKKLSILNYVRYNSELESNEENDILYSFFDFIERMLFFRSLGMNEYIGLEVGSTSLEEDIISKNLVSDFERFLNKVGIECKLKAIRLVGKRQLFFDFGKKQIHFSDIASQGTKSLTLFYFWLQKIREVNKVSFVFIDEFDAFYHHELSELVVEELKKTGVQFVLTTHNTSVMSNDLLRPDCYFIMNKERIASLPYLTDKELREGHNLEKIYKANGFTIRK